jgi:hypothetical protein
MLPILLIFATLAQDGPVLSPPADPAGAEVGPAGIAPDATPPPPDRRAALRRILRPRPAPAATIPTSPASATPPATLSPRRAETLDVLPEALEIQPAPRTAPAPLSPATTLDPLGLDDLPPELQLQPAGAAVPSAPRAPSPPRPANVIPLEILPEEAADPLLPALGRAEPDAIEGFPEPEAPSRPDRGRKQARRGGDDDLDADRRLERELRQTILGRLGRQVRDVDVRVRGERVSIRADVNFLWNRRPVRRAIESLPDLAGYQIDLDTY